MRKTICIDKAINLEWIVPNMSTINISHLRLLATYALVVDCGSFAEAARRVQSSRSRVSEQISQLESQLGVRLLQRSTRQLTITDEGKMVYAEAKKLHDIIQSIDQSLVEPIPSGRVSITVTNDIAHKFLLPLLPNFKAKYPEISLNVITSDQRLDLIAENIDLGIRIGLPRDDALIGRVLYQERFSLYASKEYIEKHTEPSSINELQNHRWILLQQLNVGASQHLMLDEIPFEVTPTQYEISNSPHFIQEMVKAGLGISTLLPSTVKNEVAEGSLVRIFPRVSSAPLLFTLVYPSRMHVPSRTRALIDYLVETCRFG